MKLSPHFALAEFLHPPVGPNDVPIGVLENLTRLCATLLEPARVALGMPILVTSGYRTPGHNTAIGGAKDSDHLHGLAADIHAEAGGGDSWEDNTLELFDWLRTNRLPYIGQLILEDHRFARGRASSLWVHVSATSPRHPGPGDGNQLLVSLAPKVYRRWSESMGGTA